jgi:hypothetical protein
VIEKLEAIDVISSGIKSDFWVMYLKPSLLEELDQVKKCLIGCNTDRVEYLQSKAQCLIEIMEKPTRDIKTILEKEKQNGNGR